MGEEHGAIAILQLLTGPGALAVGYYLMVTGQLVSGKTYNQLAERISRLEAEIAHLRSEIDDSR